jgi:WhiB family transcriptional regulator, redox-sensing transcriptional regulator
VLSMVERSSTSWQQAARCRGIDPDVFHPQSDEEADEAKAICASCPVREPCLEYALIVREKLGVWGGLTERERRRVLRHRRKSA